MLPTLSPAQWSSLKSIAITAIGALFALAVEVATQWVTANQSTLGFTGALLLMGLGSQIPGQINAWLKSLADKPAEFAPPSIDEGGKG